MIRAERPLILGSRSPRRAEILATLGLPFRVVEADIDERARPGEAPESYIERIVDDKARAVSAVLAVDSAAAALVADTVVTLGGRIYGKPSDGSHALEMLRELAGTAHQVMTRYRIDVPGGRSLARSVASEVHFRQASELELLAYAASGEGLDKAGAYAIQGLGSFLVERLVGSYGAVVGLPACELIVDLQALGLLEGFPLAP